MAEESPQETSKETRIFLIIGSIAFAALLLFLVFGLKHQKTTELNKVTFNYFTFTEVGGLWQTDINVDGQPYEGVFRFNPEQVKDVYITGNLTAFKKEPVYITFDPNASSGDFKYLALGASELSLHLVRALNVSVVAACTSNDSLVCEGRQIVTCEDKDKNVIYLDASPPTQITLDGRCVKLSGLEMDLLKSIDRLLFQWYRIMK